MIENQNAKLYQIDSPVFDKDLLQAWSIAGKSLQAQGQGALNWIKANLYPPHVDHLSFRVGNQIFCVLINVTGFRSKTALTDFEKDRLINFCKIHNLIPCVFPVRKSILGSLEKQHEGWNLFDLRSGTPIIPPALISEQLIPMSDWEIHDFGIQTVVSHLEKNGCRILSYQSMLDLDPSLWFEKNGKRCWAMVRTVKYPESKALKPTSIDKYVTQFSTQGYQGFFGSVAVVGDKQSFGNQEASLLYRGHELLVRFDGLMQA